MEQFKMCTTLQFYDSFQEFTAGMAFGQEDLILSSASLYEKFIRPLGLECPVILPSAYGKGEPSTVQVDAIRQAMPKGIRRIIAIGGGSVMDIAKMLSLEVSSGKTEDLFLSGEEPRKVYEIVAVPATCGTGSEVTNACAVELVSLHTKRGLSNDLMFPPKAVLIPELLYDLPYRFFATSSIDALIHAVESYLSPKASPVSELFSEKAVRMILEGYLYVTEHGKETWTDRARNFQTASTYAGLAFCSAGCAAVHALSYPLGGGYHIPHGEANQLVFAATFRKYKEKQPVGKLNRLEALLGEILGTEADGALDAAFELLDRIQPRKPLREYGITEEQLRPFAEGVLAGQTRLLNNNYVPLTVDDMVSIYQAIY